MDCGACERRLQTVLGRLDGVGAVEADHITGRVRVRFGSSRGAAGPWRRLTRCGRPLACSRPRCPTGFSSRSRCSRFWPRQRGEQPVLCVLDDTQLVDRASMEALAFAARRVQSDPVAMLFAARDLEGWDFDAAGMRELQLSGLDPRPAAAVLAERCGAGLASSVRDTLVRSTGGNPLALLEAAGALTMRQQAGRDLLPDPLPLAGGLEQLFLDRVRRRSPEVQLLLLLAAAEGVGHLGVVGRAASLLGLDPHALESSELGDLLVIDGPAVGFRHPLVRSAAYHAASPAHRRAAHLALADALGVTSAGSDRRAWHRAQGAAEPEEDIAAELEQLAMRAPRRSGYAADGGGGGVLARGGMQSARDRCSTR